MTASHLQWIDLYRMMLRIRAFELQVVDPYKHALIRGSTHVYLR